MKAKQLFLQKQKVLSKIKITAASSLAIAVLFLFAWSQASPFSPLPRPADPDIIPRVPQTPSENMLSVNDAEVLAIPDQTTEVPSATEIVAPVTDITPAPQTRPATPLAPSSAPTRQVVETVTTAPKAILTPVGEVVEDVLHVLPEVSLNLKLGL